MILTNSDYGTLRDTAYRAGFGKEELKGLTTLPSKSQLTAIFQAIEDRMVAAAVLAKGDIETILGEAITNDFLKKLIRVWMRWRDSIGG